MTETGKVRIDKYLWAIRIFKTRRLATDACNSGKVKLNGANVKPARIVALGDQYDIKTESRKWLISVTGIISNRVAYEVAMQNYIDITPAELLEKKSTSSFVFPTGKRPSKKGRPTKKDKRKLDDFLG